MVAMKQVFSSHVHAVGYDATKKELHVEYKKGGRAVYKNVENEKAQQVLNGASIGKALHTHVRGAHDHEMF